MTGLTFSNQIEMITLDKLVPNNHIYRKFMKLWDLLEIKIELEKIEVTSDHKGCDVFRVFFCLLVQFMENLSDRELGKEIASNIHLDGFVGLD